MMLYVIWYHLYNLKNMKNAHGGVLLLVKLQADGTISCKALQTATLLKVTILYERFLRFSNCTNRNKWRNASHLMEYKQLPNFPVMSKSPLHKWCKKAWILLEAAQ